MKSVAVVCPIHEPKIGFGKRLVDSFNRYCLNLYADFYFVFSSADDVKNYGGFERYLIAPDICSGGGVVNKKKLWAVKKLAESGYEYVITVDADFLFIRNVDLAEVCKIYFEKKIVISNFLEAENFTRINRCCLSHFRNNIESCKIDVRLYFWLNMPCIYSGKTVIDFFHKMDSHDNFKAYIWEDFDYILYTY